jgi:hypothetical protein
MRMAIRIAGVLAVLAATLSLGGCSSSVGVGLNVDVPIGDHASISLGTHGWH